MTIIALILATYLLIGVAVAASVNIFADRIDAMEALASALGGLSGHPRSAGWQAVPRHVLFWPLRLMVLFGLLLMVRGIAAGHGKIPRDADGSVQWGVLGGVGGLSVLGEEETAAEIAGRAGAASLTIVKFTEADHEVLTQFRAALGDIVGVPEIMKLEWPTMVCIVNGITFVFRLGRGEVFTTFGDEDPGFYILRCDITAGDVKDLTEKDVATFDFTAEHGRWSVAMDDKVSVRAGTESTIPFREKIIAIVRNMKLALVADNARMDALEAALRSGEKT